MKKIRLKDYERKIVAKLINKEPFSATTEDFTIVGFGRIGVQDEIADSIVLGGKGIPVVVIVGLDSGLVYQVSLFRLFPELREKTDG